MKKTFISVGASILLLTGCASTNLGINDVIQNTKLIAMTPNVPQIKRKYSIVKYKSKSFNVVLKNIYANPIHKYSSVYVVDCKTISQDNNLTGANYLCHRVKINGEWQWRPQWIQDNIDKKINKLFTNAKEELNKFCIAKGGYVIANKKFYNKNGKLKDMRNACIVNNKVYFAFTEKNEYSNNKGLKIWSPEYFKIKNMNLKQKFIALKKFMLKNNAKKINNFLFDVSNYKANLYYSLNKYFKDIDYTYGPFSPKMTLDVETDNFEKEIVKKYTKYIFSKNLYNYWWNSGKIVKVYYLDSNKQPLFALLKSGREAGKFYQFLFLDNFRLVNKIKNSLLAKDKKNNYDYINTNNQEIINY